MIYGKVRYWIWTFIPVLLNVILGSVSYFMYADGNIGSDIAIIRFMSVVLYPVYLAVVNIIWYPHKKILFFIVYAGIIILSIFNLFLYGSIHSFESSMLAPKDRLVSITLQMAVYILSLSVWPVILLIKVVREKLLQFVNGKR